MQQESLDVGAEVFGRIERKIKYVPVNEWKKRYHEKVMGHGCFGRVVVFSAEQIVLDVKGVYFYPLGDPTAYYDIAHA